MLKKRKESTSSVGTQNPKQDFPGDSKHVLATMASGEDFKTLQEKIISGKEKAGRETVTLGLIL